MGDLSGTVNLRKALIADLEAIGIAEPAELRRLGSVEVAARIVRNGSSVCANKLYALEGAIRGVRWHVIPAEERARLWRAFQEATSLSGEIPL